MQTQIYNLLESYDGKFNDSITRAEITILVQDYINTLHDYSYTVRCDTTNNTPETIDRNELIVNIDSPEIASILVKYPNKQKYINLY